MKDEEREYWDELIFKVLNNEADEVMEKHLLAAMNKNPELSEIYDLNKALFVGIRNKGRQQILEQLKYLDSEYDNEKNSKSKSIYYWLVAAVLILSVCIGAVWFSNNTDKSQNLFDAYFQHFELLETNATRGGFSQESLLFKSTNIYSEREYSKAIELFRDAIDSTYQIENMYLGVSYLGNDNPRKAIEVFKKYIYSKGAFKNDANWYIALSYIKLNDFESAQMFLREVVDNENAGIKASELMKKLE